MAVPKRISQTLLNSINAGVTPRVGLEHLVVGRKKEITSILMELESIREGGASFKFVVGRYGSGKSFLLQLLRNLSLDKNFVTADCDLSPQIRLTGTKGQGLATYRSLIANMATKVRPDGNALSAIIEKWLSGVYNQVFLEKALKPGDVDFEREVHIRIHSILNNLEGMVHGFEFANVLSLYERANRLGNDDDKALCARFFRGEYETKTEAKKLLNVTSVINDENWYEYLKLIAAFIHLIGYSGLIVIIDEGVNLYKISNSVSRQNNYEQILNMFNDMTQGKAQHIGMFFAGTPQFMEDSRRGLYSYEALRSRLAEGAFAVESLTDNYGPVIRLSKLESEDLFVLLKKVADIHSGHFGYVMTITDEQIIMFMQKYTDKIGTDKLMTPREIIRSFAGILNIMIQNEGVAFEQLVDGVKAELSAQGDDEDDDFADFEV